MVLPWVSLLYLKNVEEAILVELHISQWVRDVRSVSILYQWAYRTIELYLLVLSSCRRLSLPLRIITFEEDMYWSGAIRFLLIAALASNLDTNSWIARPTVAFVSLDSTLCSMIAIMPYQRQTNYDRYDYSSEPTRVQSMCWVLICVTIRVNLNEWIRLRTSTAKESWRYTDYSPLLVAWYTEFLNGSVDFLYENITRYNRNKQNTQKKPNEKSPVISKV